MDYHYTDIFEIDGQLIVAETIEEAIKLAYAFNVLNDGYEVTNIRRITADYPHTYYAIEEEKENCPGLGIGISSHEYVDLGLPSGTLWATCNIGAENPEDAGLYFQWGDTQGYTAAQVGTDKVFDCVHYKYSNADGSEMTKYNSTDGKTVLDNEDDAAYVNWGSDWKMPTLADIEELTANTTHEVVTVNGVSGMSFTSKNGNGNSIFVPFAGCAGENDVLYVEKIRVCYYWSSSLNSEYNSFAHKLYVKNNGNVYIRSENRCVGFPVRPVRVQNQ